MDEDGDVQYLSVEDLTRVDLPGEDFPIDGLGMVRVRGLSRWEVLQAQKQASAGVAAMERVMLSTAMVQPRMTEAQVTAAQKAKVAGLLEPLMRKVRELSGMAEGAAKAQYKSVPEGSDAGVRVLPGAEAGDDAGTADPTDLPG